ncbi:MAG: outer membrane protein transport protein [Candidatus Eisenbacteria bacterium]
MKLGRLCLVAALAALVMAVPLTAFATNGYFSHGVGLKAKGMGGATLALPQDAFAGGNNPAAAAFTGDRFDVGIDYFRPVRSSEITGSMNPAINSTYDANVDEYFLMPEIGVTKALSDRLAIGLAVYGNGGMNTSYDKPIPLFDGRPDGAVNPGVDLMQAFIVPTVAVKLNEQHAVGLGVNVAWQRFAATGLFNFDNEMMTSNPGSVTDNDYATSTGFGARIGWLGQLSDAVSVAVAYQTRTYMGEFDEYKGLFAENGGFDVPASFHGGIAVMPMPGAVVAVDVSYIQYSEIKSIANPLLPNLGEAQLGTEGGAGFGWEDVTVVKVGVAYDVTADVTVRAGYNYGGQPIPESETLFNMLAPGVIEQHVTLGGTWRPTPSTEISFAYMHALENTVEGADSIPVDFGGGEADLTMSQDTFGIAFGMGF